MGADTVASLNHRVWAEIRPAVFWMSTRFIVLAVPQNRVPVGEQLTDER